MTADPEQAARARSLLRTAIRDARATARPGDLFTSAIAADLRARIETAVQAIYRANAASFGDLDDSALRTVPLAVNDTLPWGAADVRWGAVLEALPDLPKELAYRLVGRDLVLLDVETDLVVDVLERAFFLDRPGALDPVEAPDMCAPESLPLIGGAPCLAHPELEMCWS